MLSWLREPLYVYFAVVYVALGIAIIYSCGNTERAIRLVGGALQIMGLSTVIWGIAATRKQFGHTSGLRLAASWFRRCPIVRRTAYLEPDGITVGASLIGIRLTSVFTPKPDLSFAERLTVIEKGILTVQQRVSDAESQMDQERGNTHGKIAAETNARERGDKEVMKQLEGASTGGVYISAIGTLWLFAGLVLSTASPELAAYFR
ncbi:MAG TPA: hypothetical protein VN679_09200 [Candidatus Acidoferrales bacterium]|nr:hypothetical protein [Candidatus Acidoferrales bacterium]